METPKTVLVCEDNIDIREVTKYVLEQKGYRVVTCDSGRKIFRTILTSRPDIILLDIRLPDMNGDLIAQKLKNYKSTKHIPVILFSALSHGEKIAKSVGADGFLPKPFNITDLEEIIYFHLYPALLQIRVS